MQNLCTNVPSIYCCGNSLNVSEEVPPPMADGDTGLEKLVLTRLLRLNATLQGVVTGTVVGLGVFIATNWLLLKGGEVVGPHLSLLGQFFIGYRVSFLGSFIGFAYGFVLGFVVGYFVARIYNWIVAAREDKRLDHSRLRLP